MAKENPIEIWRRKLDELQRQEAIIADPNLKFQLQEQIREIEERIFKLASRPRHAAWEGDYGWFTDNTGGQTKLRFVSSS